MYIRAEINKFRSFINTFQRLSFSSLELPPVNKQSKGESSWSIPPRTKAARKKLPLKAIDKMDLEICLFLCLTFQQLVGQ